ncbi:helix-turn-helix domain-containing protein [Pseudomonas sp. 14P_8.1_Bac3]|uniref:helix-turn-helix domain-containing protein n=1 Tax=Pseudomonas sp. 14P_8.1_Bac3 TaxID=2971621 RepID=UPI0021C84CC4|nr:helix-turn-helix domain-containing protein [Pseudomonas sp. 14P_8.1_Bac3]MCU1758763.1 helix-turn-helix domain-containing protein [Pseudomonas sp. 14P_8.1_Bac3]
MTAKLSPDSIGLIFTMNAAGHCAEEIADAAGCSYSTVVRYLNQAGVVLGNKGKPKQCTADYMALALDMRAQGSTWYDVERHVGFHRSTFHSQLRSMRANQ